MFHTLVLFLSPKLSRNKFVFVLLFVAVPFVKTIWKWLRKKKFVHKRSDIFRKFLMSIFEEFVSFRKITHMSCITCWAGFWGGGIEPFLTMLNFFTSLSHVVVNIWNNYIGTTPDTHTIKIIHELSSYGRPQTNKLLNFSFHLPSSFKMEQLYAKLQDHFMMSFIKAVNKNTLSTLFHLLVCSWINMNHFHLNISVHYNKEILVVILTLIYL